MTKRTRFVLAVCACALGLAALGYWAYTMILVQAFVGMFSSFGAEAETSSTVAFDVLPYAGSLLLLAGIALLVAPHVRRRLDRVDP